MKNTSLESSRVSSLRESIFSTIQNTKLQTVSNLIRNTRSRGHSNQPSDLKPSAHSLNIHSELSPHRLAFSPQSLHSHNEVHHSIDNVHPLTTYLLANPLNQKILKGSQKQIFLLVNSQKRRDRKKKTGSSHSKDRSKKRGEREQSGSSYSRSKNSKSHDKESKLNLSSIVEQESCESKVKTPKSNNRNSRGRSKRKFSGQPTKKKEKKNFKSVVWKRLEKSLKEPEKYQKLLKNDLVTVKFRVLRKTLLQIQLSTQKNMFDLCITLQKGNLECQGIQEIFGKIVSPSNFSLYSSVRGVDLNEPFRLPQLQIEAVLQENQRFEKVITLPYCWIHLAEENLRSVQRSRIKTKACIEDMGCSKTSLKSLIGVLPCWNCYSIGRGIWVWQSRMNVCEYEFEFRVLQRDGRYGGQLSGKGEDKLTLMMQFLQQLMK